MSPCPDWWPTLTPRNRPGPRSDPLTCSGGATDQPVSGIALEGYHGSIGMAGSGWRHSAIGQGSRTAAGDCCQGKMISILLILVWFTGQRLIWLLKIMSAFPIGSLYRFWTATKLKSNGNVICQITSAAAGDENIAKITTFSLQCNEDFTRLVKFPTACHFHVWFYPVLY